MLSGRNSYKKTLNLPLTPFAMRAGLANREPKMLARWEEGDLYARAIQRRKDQGAPHFVMHDGPPYANGSIHIGHILNKILKDFVVKYQLLNGKVAEFIPGWDCHGLPIELKVDKKLGKKKANMTDVQIRQACREYAIGFVNKQRDEFRRLMILADWDKPYRTLDPTYEAMIVRELGALIDGGYLTKGLKPVYWSWAAQTALAEAEVEHQEHTSPSIYVKFELPNPPAALAEAAGDRPVSVVIWTTTPWTLPANQAICFRPKADYSLIATEKGDALVVATALVDALVEVCNLGAVETLTTFTPEVLDGLKAKHPFIEGQESVLLLGEHVTLDTGTGAVHTAPGHGADDYKIGLANGLPPYSPVNQYGKYTDEVPEYEGIHVFKANPIIVARLAESGHLLSSPSLSLTHSYPHCWRTGKPIIFRATEQWFVSIDHKNLRQRALDAIGETKWLPSWGEERIKSMIANRPDWCVTRQRRWGVPLPIVYCEACGAAQMNSDVAEILAKRSETETTDVWWADPASAFLPEGMTCGDCGEAEGFRKEMDIVDVWIDSGVSFAAVTEARLGGEGTKKGQADLYLEGSDQHRGWFHSSLLMSLATRGQAPYKAVLTHGFVLDENGRKISKSLGNYVPPIKMINQYGAEVLRLWVASEDIRGDLKFGEDIVKQVSNTYRKIRNTWRFMLGALSDFNPAQATPFEEMEPLDQWILLRANAWLAEISEAYEKYDFTAITRKTILFTTQDLSAFYLDILKDRLYASGPDWATRRAAQSAIYRILSASFRALAPILSFTAEEAWGFLPGAVEGESIFLTDFPTEVVKTSMDEASRAALMQEWDALREVRGVTQQHLEQSRREKKIGSSQKATLTLTADGETLALLRRHEEHLADVMIVSRVDIVEGAVPEGELLGVVVEAATAERCPRCWNHREDIGTDDVFKDVCGRCAKALTDAGFEPVVEEDANA